MTTIRVPGTTKAGAATVTVSTEGKVTMEGREIGTIGRGSYTYSPRAAGHGGRIARFHTSVGEWTARTTEGREYRGGIYPSHHRKNTRKAALAFLVAAAAGAEGPGYFYWEG